MSKFFLICIFTLSLIAHAGETDQLTCRVQETECPQELVQLRDSLEILNSWANQSLEAALSEINQKQIETPDEAIKIVAKYFSGSFSLLFTPVESWLVFNLSLLDLAWGRQQDVYAGATQTERGFVRFIPNHPTVKMSGILLGVDKLSHFFAQGWEYMQILLSNKNSTLSKDAVELKIKKYGTSLEDGLFGNFTTGIFSYADLAANWQGYQFYQQLFSSKNPYFLKDKKWKIIRKFNFQDYLTDDFDEVLNPNTYLEESLYLRVWEQIYFHCTYYYENPIRFLNRTGKVIYEDYFDRNESDKKRQLQRKSLQIEQTCKQP